MLNQVLEYRRFVQTFRTEKERRDKLVALAAKVRCLDSAEDRMRAILSAYARGDDILDPDLFERADIVRFAEENRIQNDPKVLEFINKAR